MPVTTKPAAHDPTIWSETERFSGELPVRAQHEEHLLASACSIEYQNHFGGRIVATSFNIDDTSQIYALENGFVNGAIQAYAGHHRLIIRPEDVWFAILSQLSLYVNANDEGLRSRFVAGDGYKGLAVVQMATLQSADFRRMAFDTSKVLQENVVDPELRKWMMPAFSTTRKQDEDVASVIMMGSMQSYFDYSCYLRCGLPSVTLLGERSDWEDMLDRLEKLRTFGPEPSMWCNLLTPVLSAFVETFNAPEALHLKSFWQKIIQSSELGGSQNISGWITAFCFWDAKGRPLYRPNVNPPVANTTSLESDQHPYWFELSGTYYHLVCMADIAPGWASVPMVVVDGSVVFKTRMVAGSVGVRVTPSEEGNDLDTLQPISGWWIFEGKHDGQAESVAEGASRKPSALTGSLEDEFRSLSFRVD